MNAESGLTQCRRPGAYLNLGNVPKVFRQDLNLNYTQIFQFHFDLPPLPR